MRSARRSSSKVEYTDENAKNVSVFPPSKTNENRQAIIDSKPEWVGMYCLYVPELTVKGRIVPEHFRLDLNGQPICSIDLNDGKPAEQPELIGAVASLYNDENAQTAINAVLNKGYDIIEWYQSEKHDSAAASNTSKVKATGFVRTSRKEPDTTYLPDDSNNAKIFTK